MVEDGQRTDTRKDKVLSDGDIRKTLTTADIDHVFDSGRLVENVDRIFKRVFGNSGSDA